jgi:tetratricopeptide (TPR) repeat protein
LTLVAGSGIIARFPKGQVQTPMSQKLSRRDMKRNDLAEGVRHTVDYVAHHRRGVTEAAGAAVVIALLIGGFFLFRAWRERQAAAELSAGLEALEMPLASDQAAKGAARTFPTDSDREKEAKAHFEKAAGVGGTSAGRAAALVLAARAGVPTDADAFAKAARERASEISTPGEIDSARLLAAQGKAPEAMDRLRRAIDSSRTTAPKDALLFALGEICEQSGNAVEAKAAFDRIVNEFPDSPYRQDARSKVSGS